MAQNIGTLELARKLDSQYRVRVQAHWRDHPTSRPRHIRTMVCGGRGLIAGSSTDSYSR
jgi:hypothetical protein